VLCDDSCADVQDDVTSQIDILASCIGGWVEQTYDPIIYNAECTGSLANGHARWDFMRVDTTQVGDSQILVQVSTGNDEADALDGPFETIFTATFADPDRMG